MNLRLKIVTLESLPIEIIQKKKMDLNLFSGKKRKIN